MTPPGISNSCLVAEEPGSAAHTDIIDPANDQNTTAERPQQSSTELAPTAKQNTQGSGWPREPGRSVSSEWIDGCDSPAIQSCQQTHTHPHSDQTPSHKEPQALRPHFNLSVVISCAHISL